MFKNTMFIPVLLFLVSCGIKPSPDIDNHFQDAASKTITLLVSKEELADISSEFTWQSISSWQELDEMPSDGSTSYELATRKFMGQFQAPNGFVVGQYQAPGGFIVIQHTIIKHDEPIDKDVSQSLSFDKAPEDIRSSYFPIINTSGFVVSQCVFYGKTGQICKVNTTFRYIESNIYVSTLEDYDEETLSKWLNSIAGAVETRIILNDTPE